MSYSSRHIKSKIKKIRPKKSILRRPVFWLILLIFLLIFTVCYFLVLYPGFQIKDITVFGNQKVLSKDIESLVSNNINNKILSIFGWTLTSKSIFITSSGQLKEDLLDRFPTIGGARVSKKFPQTLLIQVDERVPVAVFCPSLDKTVEGQGGECYLVDENGTTFEASYSKEQDMPVVRQEITNGRVFVGERVVQQNIMDLFLRAEKLLKDNFQINISEVIVTSPIRLNIKTSESWQIYFNLDQDHDSESQLAKLNILLAGEISTESRNNLRYIDLRPESKAIICDNNICGQ